MDKKWIILLLIIICGIICFVYMTTPELTVDNFHAKKYVETIKYTYSGDIKKFYFIKYDYDVTQNKALDLDAYSNLRLFDKNGNLLDEKKFGSADSKIHEQNNLIEVTSDIFKKADTIQLIFYKGDGGELYNITTKITNGDGEIIEADDTPAKPSKNTGRSYPTESMYHTPEKKNYIVISKPGEPELREYVPEWGAIPIIYQFE